MSISDQQTTDPLKFTEPVVPAENPPTTLMQWAVLILRTSNPALKVVESTHSFREFECSYRLCARLNELDMQFISLGRDS